VNEIVRNAVDIPGNANRVDEAEKQHQPEWHLRKYPEHSEEVEAVQNAG
jgi:hypothetical protein